MIKTLSKFFKKKRGSSMGIVSKSFEVHGKVQNVMFRQTFIRGAMKRHLSGGATNDPENERRSERSRSGPDAGAPILS